MAVEGETECRRCLTCKPFDQFYEGRRVCIPCLNDHKARYYADRKNNWRSNLLENWKRP